MKKRVESSEWMAASTSFAEVVIEHDCNDNTNNCQRDHKSHHNGFPLTEFVCKIAQLNT